MQVLLWLSKMEFTLFTHGQLKESMGDPKTLPAKSLKLCKLQDLTHQNKLKKATHNWLLVLLSQGIIITFDS